MLIIFVVVYWYYSKVASVPTNVMSQREVQSLHNMTEVHTFKMEPESTRVPPSGIEHITEITLSRQAMRHSNKSINMFDELGVDSLEDINEPETKKPSSSTLLLKATEDNGQVESNASISPVKETNELKANKC